MFKRHEHWRVRSGQKIWTHKWPTTFPNLDCANSHKICTFCWNFSTSAWFFRLWKVSIKTAGRSKSNLKSFLRRWLNCLAQVSSVSPPASLILLWNMPFSSIKSEIIKLTSLELWLQWVASSIAFLQKWGPNMDWNMLSMFHSAWWHKTWFIVGILSCLLNILKNFLIMFALTTTS